MKSSFCGPLTPLASHVWTDQNNDLVVSWKYVERGILVNYDRHDVQEIANGLKNGATTPNEALWALVKKEDQDLMWFHAVNSHAYLLIGNTIDRFKERYYAHKVPLTNIKAEEIRSMNATRKIELPTDYQLHDKERQIDVIRSGSMLSQDIQKELQWIDCLVAHIIYQESLIPPSERQLLFILPNGTN